jgi:phosphomevalonate kinase
MDAVRLSAPGNLLLLGEYAVTEEGGLGLALAVERRVHAEVDRAASLVVEGRWVGNAVRWTPESPESSILFSAVVDAWRERMFPPKKGRKKIPAGEIVVDSSAFFEDGRKSGFGSSAAVAVALSCALLSLCGLRGADLTDTAALIALEAHRRAQNGRGSGYDVYASLYGGIGRFTGGEGPAWQEADLPWLPGLYLLRGPASVSTPGSISRYESWKQGHPRSCRRFLQRSNRCVADFLGAEDWTRARKAFRDARRLGLRLGRAIGVPADIEAPAVLPAESCKALGAGGELGVCLSDTLPPDGDLEPIPVAGQGVRWHT